MKKIKWDTTAKSIVDEPLSSKELTYLESSQKDRELKQLIDQSEQTIIKVDHFYKLKKFDSEKAWNRIEPQLKKNTFNWIHIAAIFLFALATTFAVWQYTVKINMNSFETAQNDISRPSIQLNDGTTVILNHGSSLQYPNKFRGHHRKVILTGEAFFEVTSDKQKPFIIETHDATVKVLGTSFNVNAYKPQTTVEVFVQSGKVELTNTTSTTEPTKTITLETGETGTLNKKTMQMHKSTTIKPNKLSWISHNISFEFTQLDEVLLILKEVYQLEIVPDRSIDLTQKITASFKQQDPEYILDVVTLTLDLKWSEINSNTYSISKTK